MTDWNEHIRSLNVANHPQITLGPWTGPARFDDLSVEYDAARNNAVFFDRSYRGLIEITGNDRLRWLNNLTTNQLANLTPGDGAYSFATDVKGRIQFDLNVLVRPDALWLDIDRRWIDHAKSHLEKYRILEDVEIADRSAEYHRLAVTGPEAPARLADRGLTQATAMPQLQSVEINVADQTLLCFRHDITSAPGFELFVPVDQTIKVWDTWQSVPEMTIVGYQCIDVLRIEAGLPWPLTEINDDVLPAETDELASAVSFNKGCYLGQEIIERMRSRESLARKLVLIRFDGSSPPHSTATLNAEGKQAGQVTSSCFSPANNAPIAMAYLRTAQAMPDENVTANIDGQAMTGTVIRRSPKH